MERRNFVLTFASLFVAYRFKGLGKSNQISPTTSKFDRIIKSALEGNWKILPIGELIGKIATALIGTPYIEKTLDRELPERCIVTFDGFDCVTFFEVSLCLARIIKKGNFSFDDLLKEVTYTRYRDGKLLDYSSRLHYTSDWIYNNIEKGVVEDKTIELSGVPIRFKLNFMSNNPDLYIGLKNNTQQIEKIRAIEKEIANRTYYYIPTEKIPSIERLIATGDIIAIVTNKPGLDYSHTGLGYNEEQKSARFLHASSKQRKVVLDTNIADFVQGVKSNIGITVLKPLEP
jgi:hypothetical protein